MSDSKSLAIIGAGMMGGAILNGIVRNGVLLPDHITVFDTDSKKLEHFQTELKVKTAASSAAAVQGADAVLIAVKPQYLAGVLTELNGKIDKNALLISIVAGIPIKKFQDELAHQKIVRVMPNTPAQIGAGVSGWVASKEITAADRELATAILSGIGQAFEMENETQLDRLTTVSGSGPAYIYLFIEAMIDTAVHMGLQRPLAEQLVIQTFRGSVDYLESRHTHPAVLRNEVTSPGGTTAEAIFELERLGFRDAIASAMWANYYRIVELSEGKPRERSGR